MRLSKQGFPPQIEEHISGFPQQIEEHIWGFPQQIEEHISGFPQQIEEHIWGFPQQIEEHISVFPKTKRKAIFGCFPQKGNVSSSSWEDLYFTCINKVGKYKFYINMFTSANCKCQS